MTSQTSVLERKLKYLSMKIADEGVVIPVTAPHIQV